MLKVQNNQYYLFKVVIDYGVQIPSMVTSPYTVMAPYDIHHLNSSVLIKLF